LVKDVLSSGVFAIAAADTRLVDQLIEEIAAIRNQLTEATKVVAGIQGRIVAAEDERSTAERIDQAAEFALRLAATLGSLDSRLEKFGKRISATQIHLEEVESTARRWMVVATVGVALVILLMASGQVALCRLAWKNVR
jgi:chromosome segregation ATPase